MGREPDLSVLGRVVAAEQDAQLAASGAVDRDRVRAALLADAAPAAVARIHGSPVRRALVPALAMAAAIAAVLLVPWSGRRSDFRVGGAPGRVGAWIAAPETRALPVRFVDGTRIVLEAGGRARVAEVAPEGARVVLERGRAHVAVVHRARTRWLVHVGPYEVVVTGTEFDVSWDPSSEQFDLSMDHGRVRVTGPLLEEGRSVVAGESVTAEVREHRLTVAAAGEAAQVAAAPAPAPEAPAAPEPSTEPAPVPVPEAVVAERPDRPPQATATAAPWRDLARSGAYADALAAVDAAGFRGICATASGSDLLLLADAARFGGNLPRAVEALETLRRRFPRSAPAAQAAFTLGRIAFDRRRAYSDAARWFGAYMREAPGGPLAREAAGRRLEALVRTSDVAGARTAGAQYLARYPNGPHAELARRVSGP